LRHFGYFAVGFLAEHISNGGKITNSGKENERE
jgi:hypothetical protein